MKLILHVARDLETSYSIALPKGNLKAMDYSRELPQKIGILYLTTIPKKRYTGLDT